MDILPRCNEAVIPIKKLTHYALSYSADYDKATAFQKALGYKISNAHELIANIKHNLPNFPAIPKGLSAHGMKYEVIMELMGPNGKKANVLTAWIDDKHNGEMRLISVYIDKKKG